MSNSNALSRAKKRHAYACVQANRVGEALVQFQKLAESDPADAESCYMVGMLCGRQGRLAEAEAALRKAVGLQPRFAQGHLALAQTLELLGRFTDAEHHYGEAAALRPELAEAHDALGRMCQLRGDPQAAVAHHQQALARQPERPASYLLLARAQHQIGELDAAAANIEQVLRSDPHHPEAWYDLAGVRIGQGRYHDALNCIREARRLRPDYLEAQAVEAYVLEHLQDYDGALACLAPILDRYEACPVIALVYARLCPQTRDWTAAAARLESLAVRADLQDDLRAKVHFYLGELYDRQGEYLKAFPHIATANRLKRMGFDRGAWERHITDLMAIFNRDALARAPRAGNCSQRPIFIVGMPRSGTTLVRQMLGMLPDVEPAGELPDLGRLAIALQAMLENTSPANNITQLSREQCDSLAQPYLDRLNGRFPKALRWIDKMPQNFLHLGLIALLFPMAHVIHCQRDPLDTCLSCYFQEFTGYHPYAYDLADLGFYYRQYHRLMAHWRKALDVALFEIDYEDLVRDPETYGRSLVEFCGLKWDRRCLEFYKSERPVATASLRQVREPIYTASVGRWRHYDAFLQPLKDALGDLAPRL